MRFLPKSGYRRSPWKNGGGETVEMLASAEGAGLDAFDWRISSAHVGSEGPFSHFPDIDRTLSVLGAGRLVLTFEGRGAVTLDRASAPYAFPGDVAVSGVIPDGPIDDFNVMTRRGRARHHCQRVHLGGAVSMPVLGDAVFVFVEGIGVEVDQGGVRLALEKGDSCLIAASEGRAFSAAPRGGKGEILIVDLWHLG